MLLWIKGHFGWLFAILFLTVICVFLLYSWIDSRVTIEYVLQEQKDKRREIEVLQNLFLESSRKMSRSDIEQLVTKRFAKDHLIKQEERDELSIDNIILEFKGDSLVKVKSLNE